jgi:hypothetical protein
MGALAQTERTVTRGLAEPQTSPARRPLDRRSGKRAQIRPSWNVLAEELVPFPPAVTRPSVKLGSAEPSFCLAEHAGELVLAKPSVSAARAMRASADHRRVAAGPRGLRRLLPGAATLAVLVGVWLGAGALASVHRPPLSIPASAVKVQGGYLYTVRSGDTLWSIAAGLEPGGDPRPLVAELEQQLHGALLVAGDELKLP